MDDAGRLITKFLRNGKDDIQETKTALPFGFDCMPIKDMKSVYTQTANMAEPVLIGFINLDLVSEPGESGLYSTDDEGALQIYLRLKKDGTIHFGGDTGNLTRYQELETAFNQLKSDHNSLVTAFNTHMHATAATGPPVPPTPGAGIPAVASTADITGAKINEFKTL
jgi:hypothetical protein